jgi:hypothetical protein
MNQFDSKSFFVVHLKSLICFQCGLFDSPDILTGSFITGSFLTGSFLTGSFLTFTEHQWCSV